jgi:organic radical activating enzyme
LVITGGEPLLGWQKSYPDLLTNLFMYDLKNLTFETNGTQWLEASTYNFLAGWAHQEGREITFSVSPKLSISGEAHDDAINPKIIREYQEIGYTYLKFVVSKDTDIDEIEGVVNEYRENGFTGPVYLMPLGGVEQLYSLNSRAVAEMAMRKGYRYSDRLQVPLFKNEWGT